MFEILLAALAIGAYGIGSVPIHRALGLTDIDMPNRENCRCRAAARVILNMMKGLLVVEIGTFLGPVGAHMALFAVVIGHNYPIWSSFRGGTGLGVILGGLIALDPTLGLICLGTWVFAYYSFMDRTIAALTAAAVTPFVSFYLELECHLLFMLPITALVVWRHRKRLSDVYLKGPVETEDHFRHL